MGKLCSTCERVVDDLWMVFGSLFSAQKVTFAP